MQFKAKIERLDLYRYDRTAVLHAGGKAAIQPPLPATNEIIAGLAATHAFVSPKYFYDPLGSKLFEAITELPEYYPTRTERAILARCAGEILQAVGSGRTLIELGAGNCEKAKSLFGTLRPDQYLAIDISAEFLSDALVGLRRQFPAIRMRGIGMDFSAGLTLPDAVRGDRRLFFYPGSSIGNFTPAEAGRLLSDMRSQCGRDGAALIGVDLVKDETMLQAAYDDALGVTAAFNLNLLNHLNSLIGSDFDPRDWRHLAAFNAGHSRIEMHLEAKRDITVTWPGGARDFTRGERIHTENSYKYRLPDFHALLESAGFRNIRSWTDDREWFAVCLASA